MFKTLLTTHDVAYATSLKSLFSGVSVAVKSGDRIGLVGRNGAGKSTLLWLLTEEIEPDSGTVIVNGRIGYVPQIAEAAKQCIVLDALLRQHGCSHAQFSAAYQTIFSSKIPGGDVAIDALSGGERTKLWIAMIAAGNPDILLLDEPTNHLDERSIQELTAWIDRFAGAVIFVSHNRSFLSAVARSIWNLHAATLQVFTGRYDDFIQKQQQDRAAQFRQYEAVKKELTSLEKGVRLREVKAARAAKVQRKNKTEVSRSKSEENYFRNRSEKGIGKIKKQQDEKRAKKEIQLASLAEVHTKLVNVPLLSRLKSGQPILDVAALEVCIDSTVVFTVPRLRIEVGDRVAISGDNGQGKTVLLKALIQEIKQSTTAANVSYIDQHYTLVDRDLTVFENLEQHTQIVDNERIYKQLGRFQFTEQYAYKKAYELSGGELARLAFAIATIAPLDLLVLDEPTNNLDIETMEVLSAALKDFPGAVLVVSHDRSFLEDLHIAERYVIESRQLVAV